MELVAVEVSSGKVVHALDPMSKDSRALCGIGSPWMSKVNQPVNCSRCAGKLLFRLEQQRPGSIAEVMLVAAKLLLDTAPESD